MDPFLHELAQARPNPGGGAAAAYGARVALALLEKVVQLEGKRRRPAKTASTLSWEEALARLRRLAEDLTQLQDDDVGAYAQLAAARASGSGVEAAVRRAVEPPRQMVLRVAAALELLAWAGGHCRPHLVSDLLVAVEFLGGALSGAYHIACANLRLLQTGETAAALRREFCQGFRRGEDLYQMVKAALVAREDGFDHCR